MWEYRPALDGVRALAVTAVLLFHAGVPGTDGGFLGVDAFFVLSGFLITSLLLAEHQRSGRIDLGRFWLHRARRLLPALLAMLSPQSSPHASCWTVTPSVCCGRMPGPRSAMPPTGG